MNDDYLWDRTGEPDPELAHLEEALGALQWSRRKRSVRARGRAGMRRRNAWWMAAAAAVLVGIIGTAVVLHDTHSAGPLTSWQVSFAGEKPRTVRAGELLETTKANHGSLQSEFVGRVDIDPDSRLRLLAASSREQRLALDHGTIHALIWAPPAQFIVDTPAAKAVDLGCKYTLHVEKTGMGLLSVEMGWVAFEWRGTESFITAGAACRTRPGHGPDTPYFLDSSAEFQNALADFDATGSKVALERALSAARSRDGLSLWHLMERPTLERASGDERGEVFDHFAKLVHLPREVTRDAVLRADRRALDASWNALDLGDTSWWREWKKQW